MFPGRPWPWSMQVFAFCPCCVQRRTTPFILTRPGTWPLRNMAVGSARVESYLLRPKQTGACAGERKRQADKVQPDLAAASSSLDRAALLEQHLEGPGFHRWTDSCPVVACLRGLGSLLEALLARSVLLFCLGRNRGRTHFLGGAGPFAIRYPPPAPVLSLCLSVSLLLCRSCLFVPCLAPCLAPPLVSCLALFRLTCLCHFFFLFIYYFFLPVWHGSPRAWLHVWPTPCGLQGSAKRLLSFTGQSQKIKGPSNSLRKTLSAEKT